MPICLSWAGSVTPESRRNLAASKTVPPPLAMLAIAPWARACSAVAASSSSTRSEGMPSRLAAASRLWPLTT